MPRGIAKSDKTDADTESVKAEVNTESVRTDDTRIEFLEKELSNTKQTLDIILEKIQELGQSPKMPVVQKPEDRIAAMRAATLDGGVSESARSIDLRRPNDAKTGFQPNDVVKIEKNCPKYSAYQLDKDGEPVKRIYEYECMACYHREPCVRGIQGAKRKICSECKSTMERKETGEYEPGQPALGVIVSYMYTTKKGVRKYKVYFEKFSERQRSEGMLETELVKCR